MEQFKNYLLNKYKSDFMHNLIETSPIFNNENIQIYQKLKNHEFDLNGIEGRLIEGRIGEIKFGENLFFGKVFKYMGDHSLYELTTDDFNFNYTSIDFKSDFGIDVDIKLLGPTTIRTEKFASGRNHRECLFDTKDINKYLNMSERPFLLMYSDKPYYDDCHTIFVDLRLAYEKRNIIDSIYEIKLYTKNKSVYRINVEYDSQDNQRYHFLLNDKEFAKIVSSQYKAKHGMFKNCLCNVYAKAAGYST